MPLRAVTVLCAILGSASGLRLGLIRPACVRASAVRLAVEPVETPKDCVAAAETGAEAAECLVPIADPPAVENNPMVTDASTAPTTDISTEDKRRMLLGGDDSLQSCLSSAEGQAEVDECELDFERLVSPDPYAEPGDSTALSVGPAAIVGAVALIAAVTLIPH